MDVTVLRLVLYQLYSVPCGVVVRALAYRSEHPGFESPSLLKFFLKLCC